MYLPGGLIEGTHDLDHARTAGFTVLVFCQLFNCFTREPAGHLDRNL
jgi:P-type Ca2+ transporter type 2C